MVVYKQLGWWLPKVSDFGFKNVGSVMCQKTAWVGVGVMILFAESRRLPHVRIYVKNAMR